MVPHPLRVTRSSPARDASVCMKGFMVKRGQTLKIALLVMGLSLQSLLVPDAALGEEAANASTPSQRSTPGKLFICGGGLLGEAVLDQFVSLAGGAAAKIVYIPTASSYADTPELETKITFWRNQTLDSFTILHTRDRDEANSEAFLTPLKEATGVWFMGGIQTRLTETYLGTKFMSEIRRVLDRDGVVGGTSAGAAIMSPVMIQGGIAKAETGTGFGLLPGTVVDQHFLRRNRQQRLLGVVSSHPHLVGVGIDEGTALVVHGTQMSVIGESRVVICLAGSGKEQPVVRELAPGDRSNLLTLHREAGDRLSALALQEKRQVPDMPQSGK